MLYASYYVCVCVCLSVNLKRIQIVNYHDLAGMRSTETNPG